MTLNSNSQSQFPINSDDINSDATPEISNIDPSEEAAKARFLALLENQAKEQARAQVQNEARYKSMDRRIPVFRKRMDARISDVKQTIYKGLLEQAVNTNIPRPTDSVSGNEDASVRSQIQTLQEGYQALLEEKNDLQCKLQVANSEIIVLKSKHHSVVNVKEDIIRQLSSNCSSLLEQRDKLSYENEEKSRRVNELEDEIRALSSSPIVSAQALRDLLMGDATVTTPSNYENDNDANVDTRMSRASVSSLHSNSSTSASNAVDLTYTVVDDSAQCEQPSDDNVTVREDLTQSPKRKLMDCVPFETPTKRFRKLQLVLYTPDPPTVDRDLSGAPSNMPPVSLGGSALLVQSDDTLLQSTDIQVQEGNDLYILDPLND